MYFQCTLVLQVIMKMNEQMNTMKDRIKYLESELNNTEKTIEE